MAVSFSANILPLFRPIDIQHMQPYGVLLSDYTYMSNPAGDDTYPDHANARWVYAYLTGQQAPRMPLGGPYWSDAQLQLYQNRMDGGFQP